MSHINKISNILLVDHKILEKAVSNIENAAVVFHSEPTQVKMYNGNQAEDVVAEVSLDKWKYPVCIDTTGEISYDNYEGNWGSITHLNQVKQQYAIEKSKQLARNKGYLIQENKTSEGAVVLNLSKGVT